MHAPLDWSTLARFSAKISVNESTGCWEWTAARNGKGYAASTVSRDGVRKNVKAHRWLYEHLVAPVDPALQLDHLCRVRHCLNPDHLEPVTGAENTRRADGIRNNGAHLRNRTHCNWGHEFGGDNLTYTPSGIRRCRACAKLARQRWESRQRSQA